FIDSPISRFDLDKEGRLVFFELTLPKRQWKVVDSLEIPNNVEPADVRWLNFRKNIESPDVTTDKSKSQIYLKLSDETPEMNYYLADKVVVRVASYGTACGILVTEVIDDSAGRKFAEFRRRISDKPPTASLSADVSVIFPSVS
ncbi:MAG: hypothetical protein ACREBV_07890, partial [Candidatus Zixiibacteriota bacterium]